MSNPMSVNSILNPLSHSTTQVASSSSLTGSLVSDASSTASTTGVKSNDTSSVDPDNSETRDDSNPQRLKLPPPAELSSSPAAQDGDAMIKNPHVPLATNKGKKNKVLTELEVAGPSEESAKCTKHNATSENDLEAANTGQSNRGGTTKPKRQISVDQRCMNPICEFSKVSGQPETNWRTCILDHFGRNKAETNKIKTILVWCRKCYQHGSYEGFTWPGKKSNLILQQLLLICADEGCQQVSRTEICDGVRLDRECSDHCEVTFHITLRAGELKRLQVLRKDFQNDTQAYIDAGDDSDAAIQQYANEMKDGKTIRPNEKGHSRFKRQSKSYKRTPIDVLKEFQERFMGTNKTRAECIAAVEWCKAKFEEGEIDDLLRFEFILQCPRVLREIEEQRANIRANKSTSRKRSANHESEKDNNLPDKRDDTAIENTPKKRRVDHEPEDNHAVAKTDDEVVNNTSRKRKAMHTSEESDAVADTKDETAVKNAPKRHNVDHASGTINTAADKKDGTAVKAGSNKRKADDAFKDDDKVSDAKNTATDPPRSQRLKIKVSSIPRATTKHEASSKPGRRMTKFDVKSELSEAADEEDTEPSSDTDSNISHISANIDGAARQSFRVDKGKQRSIG